VLTMLRALLLDTTFAFLMLGDSTPADDPWSSGDPGPTDEPDEVSTEQATQMASTQKDRILFNLDYLQKIEAELGSAACRDEDTYCHDWTIAGYCLLRMGANNRLGSYANYMQRFCRRSCGFCRVDLDNTAQHPRFVVSGYSDGMKVKLRGSSSVTAEYTGYTATIISHTGLEYKIRLVSDDKEDELSDEEKEKEITVTQDDFGLTEDDEKDAKDQTEEEKEKEEEGEKEEEEKKEKNDTAAADEA